jgi:hypothetical protein
MIPITKTLGNPVCSFNNLKSLGKGNRFLILNKEQLKNQTKALGKNHHPWLTTLMFGIHKSIIV